MWNKNTFGQVDMLISQAKQNLLSIQNAIEQHGFSDNLHRQELDANNCLAMHLAHQETLYKDKAALDG